MIEVVVTSYPHGNLGRPLALGTIHITNDGMGGEDYGNYQVTLDEGEYLRTAEIRGFRRNRGWPGLLRETLDALLILPKRRT